MSEKETTAQMLREARKKWEEGWESDFMADSCECTVCKAVLGQRCDSGDCGRWISRLADMVEAEVEEASATRCTAYIDNLARLGRVPARNHGETLEKWLGRCYLPVPRYTDGATVEPGSVSYWGTVKFAEVEVSGGGWGNWHLHIEETSEVIDGTLNERVPRGLLVEGRPVKQGDTLWFDTDKVTVTDVDGLSDTIFTDYLTEDTEGEWFPYPFESEELSWERSAPKVLDADGVPIEVGDTVWRVNDGLRMKVRDVGDKAREHGCQVLTLLPDDDWDCCGVLHYSGKELTHSEPDTMERIRADAVKPMALYWGCAERDCCDCQHEHKPKERYGVGSCSDAMQLDIIRRTEEVCGR